MNKQRYILLLLLIWAALAQGQTTSQISYFPLQDVKLLDSPFKHAQDLNKQYLLELEADRLLAPFLREAGLPSKAASYTNWENSGLDGHIGGHYISALSLMYASTGDEEIKSRLSYMLAELQRCQDAMATAIIGWFPEATAIWEVDCLRKNRRGRLQPQRQMGSLTHS